MSARRRCLTVLLVVSLLGSGLALTTRPVETRAQASQPSRPARSALLQPTDFRHLLRLTRQLAQQADPMSAFIWSKLSPETVAVTKEYLVTGKGDANVRKALAADLNQLLRDPGFADPARLGTHKQRGTTRRLLAKTGRSPDDVVVLNRAILENAYPGRIAVSQIGKIFDDAADAAQDKADQAQGQADQQQQQADQQQQQAGQQADQQQQQAGQQQADQQQQQQQADQQQQQQQQADQQQQAGQADQQQANQQQQQADQAQAQADQAQVQADQAQAQADVAAAGGAGQAAAAADKGWTWGDFFSAVIGGLVGGAAGGATGGVGGIVAGALTGAAVGALGYVTTYITGFVGFQGRAVLPASALDGPIFDGTLRPSG